ncbi:STAS domain-containing protein [Actinoplanes sp. NBC_00393]|uniref:STAS domain-containing protein n=1 Tax=Actinoplanes sp. NBC_00393 TaxID=2975953 RepID=UPI002E1CBB7D
MTAVCGDGSGVVTVICDACGTVEEAADVLRDEDMVWPSINELGWTGSPFATGTHRCPRCVDAARVDQGPSAPPGPARGDGFTVREAGRSRVVALRAGLVQQLVDGVRPALVDAATAGRNVVIDMRRADVVDSAGLGLLVRVHRAAKHRGATLCLVAPSRYVVTVLHTMHLDGLFPIYPNVRSALRHLSGAIPSHPPGQMLR